MLVTVFRVFLLALVLIAAPLWAQNTAADEAYQRGADLYQAGKDAEARVWLEKAQRSYAKNLPAQAISWMQTNFLLYQTLIFVEDFKALDALEKQVLPLIAKYSLENDSTTGKFYYSLGDRRTKQNRQEEALKYLDASVQINLRYQKYDLAVRSLRNLARVHIVSGRYPEALKPIEQIVELYNKEKYQDREQAQTYSLLMVVYQHTGQYEKAISQLKELVAQPPLRNRQDSLNLSSNYNNLALLYSDKKQFSYAVQYYEQALALQQKLGQYDLALTTGTNLSVVYSRLKDFGRSQQVLERLKPILPKLDSNRHHYYQQSLLAYYRQQRELALSRNDYPAIWNNLQLVQKLPYHERYPSHAASLLLDLSTYYRHQKDYANALIYNQKGIALMDQGKLPISTQERIFRQRAEIETALGNYDNAILAYQTALKILDPNYEIGFDFTQVPKLQDYVHQAELTQLWLELASFFANHTQQDSLAEQILNQIMAQIPSIKASITNFEDQEYFLQSLRKGYELAIELAHRRYQANPNPQDLEKAFAACESSKALLLLQALKRNQSQTFGQVPKALLEREYELETEAYFNRQKSLEARIKKKPELEDLYRNKALGYQRSLEALLDTFKRFYPAYHQFRHEQQLLSTAQVQAILPANTGLLEYFWGYNKLYVFYVDKNKVIFKAFDPKQPALYDWAMEAFREFSQAEGSSPAKVQAQGFRLYEQLVQPFVQADVKHLIVIPDAALAYLPFAALSTAASPVAQQYVDVPYLIKKYSVHYHYAAYLLPLLKRQQASGRILGFAPTYRLPAWLDSSSLEGQQRRQLSELPGAKAELSYLSEHFQGQYFQEEQATEHNFVQETNQKGQYSILHLAMHGYMDWQNPAYSGLYFTFLDSTKGGFLQAYELSNLPMSAELAVLSACETGSGRYGGGEGLLSLGRHFLYAGVPSVAMTLWPLNDASSLLLMQEFYRALHQGQALDQALQQAQLHYIQQVEPSAAHPFFWANYITVGLSEPVRLKAVWPWWYGALLAGGSLSLIGLLGLWWRRKKNS